MGLGIVSILFALTLGASHGTPGDEEPSAREIVDRALALMGGEARLRAAHQVRFDMMTQWQRTTFRDLPGSDRPSYEPHTDVRDYSLPAWRNTRRFPGRDIVNVVRDTVATTDFGAGPQPLSVAYVDERDELFVYSPDRLILELADAPDLRRVADTLVAGESFTVLRATLAMRLDASVLFHPGTGLPSSLHFEAGHPNDFGLSPWGVMAVAVWYSNWRTFGDISIPSQWDVSRMGRPYKRMTVRAADFEAEFIPADSFSISLELRERFAVESARAMHDQPIDSVIRLATGLVGLQGIGAPAGAIDVGVGWLLLGAGHMPLNLQRGRAALADAGVTDIVGALAATTRAGNGGSSALAEDGHTIWTAAAATPLLRQVLASAGAPSHTLREVGEGVWVGDGPRRVWLESIDLPDAPGSVVLWSPGLRWVYAPDAVQPLDLRMVEERARERGWPWDVLGSSRSLATRGAFDVGDRRVPH